MSDHPPDARGPAEPEPHEPESTPVTLLPVAERDRLIDELIETNL